MRFVVKQSGRFAGRGRGGAPGKHAWYALLHSRTIHSSVAMQLVVPNCQQSAGLQATGCVACQQITQYTSPGYFVAIHAALCTSGLMISIVSSQKGNVGTSLLHASHRIQQNSFKLIDRSRNVQVDVKKKSVHLEGEAGEGVAAALGGDLGGFLRHGGGGGVPALGARHVRLPVRRHQHLTPQLRL